MKKKEILFFKKGNFSLFSLSTFFSKNGFKAIYVHMIKAHMIKAIKK